MNRQELTMKSERIVIKVGSSLLVRNFQLDMNRLRDLACNIAFLREQGKKVVLVSSGAVACGMSAMGVTQGVSDIPFKQAMAAIGQGVLMQHYCQIFAEFGIKVAQILLAPEDVHHRVKYLNARNTLQVLLDLGVLPIVNENDTVAVAEIKFGDNDRLSALVGSLWGAELLIILSDVEGLFTSDPRLDASSSLVKEVKVITPEIERMAGGRGSGIATGGMRSKIMAARIAVLSGIGVIIASGKDFSILQRIYRGEEVGTFFHPRGKFLKSKKRWIAFGMLPRGKIAIDKGAERALYEKKSLLPAGVQAVYGDFEIGDCVEIMGGKGRVIARGIVNYSAEELQKVLGLHTDEVGRVLGERNCEEEVVHIDNLVLLDEEDGGEEND
ncbi:MAG: glutamate 5-kinase [Atribacterota bacterium]|nr:glutamate 5-kinase [Atribacterota bacterium]